MQHRVPRWTATVVASALVVSGFSNPAFSSPVNAETRVLNKVTNAVAAAEQAAGASGTLRPDAIAGSRTAETVHSKNGIVNIPNDPTDGVSLATSTGAKITVGIPHARSAARGALGASGTTVYMDAASNSATAIQATSDGMRQLFVLNNSAAPTTFTVPLYLPAGAHIMDGRSGGYEFVAGQENSAGLATVASIGAPWAKDATGKSLPTTYSLNGNQLSQHVDTTGAIFPVVADPHYTWGWVTGTIYFNKTETKKFAVGVGVAGFIASLTGPWSALLRGYAAWIGAVAGWALADNKCVAFKSTLQPVMYSGNQGGGFCR
ncbi:hypothetical protein ACSMXN_22650 [Jatrophihabitans sp. DSM 45814]